MKGSCNCGVISFIVDADVSGLYQCHCKLCQKQSGSTSNTAVIVPSSMFNWESGQECIGKWKKDSGFTSHFCKTCGCPVPNKLRDTDYYWIPMGLVDDLDLSVTTHICCSSKATWDQIPEQGQHIEGMPEDLDSFIKSFRS